MKKILLSIAILTSVLTAFAQVTLTLQPDACTGKDAVMRSNSPTSNSGTYAGFYADSWTCQGNPCEGRSLLQFDLSCIPQGSTISSASLSLYADLTAGSGYLGTPTWGTDNASYLKRVTAPWNEADVTWNTQPSTTDTGQVLLPQSTTTTQDYMNIDISSLVQYWNQNPSQNYGMLLDMITAGYYNSLNFGSSDHSDSTKRPKLEICFSVLTAIKEINTPVDLKIYPNPATNELNITSGNLKAQRVSIYDVDGKLVSETIQPTGNRVDISALAKGVYIAEIKVRDVVQRIRWIKM
jgi:hypothetical protein